MAEASTITLLNGTVVSFKDAVAREAASSALSGLETKADLDSNGKIPSSQLPSYVDDIVEYATLSAFPLTGESGKLYVTQDTNKTYRWTGSAYVEISSSLALGETNSTAYRGDRGAEAYTHAVTNKGSAFVSGLYKITTNSEGHVTAASEVQKEDITSLGIPGDLSNKADKADTVLDTTLSRGRKAGSTVGARSLAFGENVEARGSNSHAEGQNTIAIGDNSHAEGIGGNYVLEGTTYTSYAAGVADHSEGYMTIAYGYYSGGAHSEGIYSSALNDAAHAEGYMTKASGGHAHAEGDTTQAIGSGAHAEGYLSTATGNFSHTEGSRTNTTATAAHAEGRSTTASGQNAHAEGYNSVASYNNAHAEGSATVASGASAHAEGNETKASGANSHAEGCGLADSELYGAKGSADHAEGYRTVANSGGTAGHYAAHSEGYLTKANAHGAHAEGSNVVAGGVNAHAEGSGTTASANNSHAEGGDTVASGQYAHAEGYYTQATAHSAHAEGYYAKATGSEAHAHGYYTIASQVAQTAFGKCNVEELPVTVEVTEANAVEWEPYVKHDVGDIVKKTIDGNVVLFVAHKAMMDILSPISDYSNTYWHQITSLPNGVDPLTVLEWDQNTQYGQDDIVKMTFASTTYYFQAHSDDILDYYPLPNVVNGYGNNNYWHTQDDGTYYNADSKYAELVGNGLGTYSYMRSNARALDWKGNEYLAGDLYVHCDGDSTGGVKVATINDIAGNVDLEDYVQFTDYATDAKAGVVKISNQYGTRILGSGIIAPYKAPLANIKTGANEYCPIVPYNQHESVFYGLAKAAGDTTMASSSNAIGTYTEAAQAAICAMLGVSNYGTEVVRLI